MSKVAQIMLSRFTTLYGEPRSPDVEGFMREYDDALRNMSDPVLRAATDLLVRRQKHRTWPTIGECYAACNEAAEAMKIKSEQPVFTQSKRVPPDENELNRQRLAKEWRDRMVEQYGSIDDALEAHQRKRGSMLASRSSTFRRPSA